MTQLPLVFTILFCIEMVSCFHKSYNNSDATCEPWTYTCSVTTPTLLLYVHEYTENIHRESKWWEHGERDTDLSAQPTENVYIFLGLKQT